MGLTKPWAAFAGRQVPKEIFDSDVHDTGYGFAATVHPLFESWELDERCGGLPRCPTPQSNPAVPPRGAAYSQRQPGFANPLHAF